MPSAIRCVHELTTFWLRSRGLSANSREQKCRWQMSRVLSYGLICLKCISGAIKVRLRNPLFQVRFSSIPGTYGDCIHRLSDFLSQLPLGGKASRLKYRIDVSVREIFGHACNFRYVSFLSPYWYSTSIDLSSSNKAHCLAATLGNRGVSCARCLMLN